MKSRGLNMLDIDCKLVTELLTRFIKNEVQKTGMNKVVLGLSGGIDSALVAFLCKEALGADNVCGVRMPYKSSSAESLSHAELVAQKSGIRFLTYDITAAADGFASQQLLLNTDCDKFLRVNSSEKIVGFKMGDTLNGHSLGNILARLRMNTLYHISALGGSMVVGTSNKTELLLGYGTLWGDLAYGINPVGDLYKYQVRQLSRYHGVPDEIILKKPSADLFPGQTDEGDLGYSYEELDYALYRLVDARENPKILAESGEIKPDLINFCLKRIIAMQFKRQMPHIALVSFRTINQSFNYPRDWAM
ncbi:MAG TPA: NAD+ synthase [Candidatus Wallbacteria bacterium]|nr:NAD+ synthase [Candidatus Wallbacteria bacterium]